MAMDFEAELVGFPIINEHDISIAQSASSQQCQLHSYRIALFEKQQFLSQGMSFNNISYDIP
jgi:hypothetical protein